MGCGGSKAPFFGDDVGPDGPLDAAPEQLLVIGHATAAYDGLYQRGPAPWNGKAVYWSGSGRVLYYYAANEGLPDYMLFPSIITIEFLD